MQSLSRAALTKMIQAERGLYGSPDAHASPPPLPPLENLSTSPSPPPSDTHPTQATHSSNTACLKDQTDPSPFHGLLQAKCGTCQVLWISDSPVLRAPVPKECPSSKNLPDKQSFRLTSGDIGAVKPFLKPTCPERLR